MPRKKPYTQIGVSRMKCWNPKCHNRAEYQWQVCADGNTWRPVCLACDIALNRAALTVMNDPEAEEKLKRYVDAKLDDRHG